MKREINVSQDNQPWKFFILIFLFSIPGYIFGGAKLPLPVNLPVSALMIFFPAISASLLVYKKAGRDGIKQLWKKSLDTKKIANKNWYIPILLVCPLIYFFTYLVMRIMGLPISEPETPILLAPVLFVVFFISAIFEELGWMGYAITPLQNRWGALPASIIIGLVWQVWHIIPDLQLDYSASWIFWHSLQSIALRVLIVWIYNNTGGSVFSSIMIHAMDNLSWALFPNFDSGFNPFYAAIFAWLFALAVIILWDSKTLTHYRFSKA